MIRILLAVLCCFSFLSYSQPSEKVLKHVPKDASMVVSFNFSRIVDKINLDTIKALQMVQFGYNHLRLRAGKDSVIVRKIWDDPKSYGVALEPASVVSLNFLSGGQKSLQPEIRIVVPLVSKKKLEKLLKTLLDDYSDFTQKEKGYSYYESRNLGLAWSKEVLIIYGSDNLKESETRTKAIKGLMNINAEESLLKNKKFMSYIKRPGDVSYYVNLESYFKSFSQTDDYTGNSMFQWVDLEAYNNLDIFYSLSFDNGQLNFDYKQSFEDLPSELFTSSLKGEINPAFYKYINQDQLIGCFSFATDIEKVKEYYFETFPQITDSLEAKMEEAIVEERTENDSTMKHLKSMAYNDSIEWEERQEIKDQMAVQKDSLEQVYAEDVDKYIDSTLYVHGFNREDLWKLFKGDLLVAVTGVYEVIDTFTTHEYGEDEDGELGYIAVEKTKKKKLPLFKAFATINLPDNLKKALTKFEEDEEIQSVDGKGYYIIGDGENEDEKVYFGLNKENILVISNDENFMVDHFLTGQGVNNPIEGEIKKKIESQLVAGYVDIKKLFDVYKFEEDADWQTKDILTLVKENLISASFASTVEASKKEFVGGASIDFSKQDNSFHTLMTMFNTVFMKFAGFL